MNCGDKLIRIPLEMKLYLLATFARTSTLLFMVNALTIHDAMNLAIKGDIDNDAVLGTFFREHFEAELSGDSFRLSNIKANLGALLIDLANISPDPRVYRAMYSYCEDISKELLALDVSKYI